MRRVVNLSLNLEDDGKICFGLLLKGRTNRKKGRWKKTALPKGGQDSIKGVRDGKKRLGKRKNRGGKGRGWESEEH